MAIKEKFPAIRPSLNLDFTRGTVDPRISFTRSSGATRVNSKGLIEVAPAEVPRIDYDPVTRACKGLLIEEQRTNLLTYSEQFDNAAWAKSGASVLANQATAPDGTLTADKLIASAINAEHYADGVFQTTSGVTYTLSVFYKCAEKSVIQMRTAGNTEDSASRFNLTTGTIIASAHGVEKSGIKELGNGWYRCWVVFTATSTGNTFLRTQFFEPASVFTGDGTSGIYIWGAQLEAGSFPTSYIPTTTAAVTRAADVAVMTGTNFSSWYRQDEGTLFGEFGPYENSGTGKNPGIAQLDDQTTNNLIRHFAGSSVSPVFGINTGGVNQAYISSGAITPSVISKTAGAYKTDDIARSFNGLAVGTDVSAVVPTVNRLLIGSGSGGINELNGYIRRVAFYPRRLSNTELQAITA